MAPIVETPDGKEIEFPDSMSGDAINAAMRKLYPPKQPTPLSWSEAGSEALHNLPSSLEKTAGNILQPFMHPVDTAKAVEKGGKALVTHPVDTFNAFSNALWNKYGTLDKVKQSLANDPAGTLLDLMSFMSPVSKGLGETFGPNVGRIAEAVSQAPLNAASKVVEQAGQGAGKLASTLLSKTTGTTPEAVAESVKGVPEYMEQVRGGASEEEAMAQNALSSLNKLRSVQKADYRKALEAIPDRELSMEPMINARDEALSRYDIQKTGTGTLDLSDSPLEGSPGVSDIHKANDFIEKAYNKADGTITFKKAINLKRKLSTLADQAPVKPDGSPLPAKSVLLAMKDSVNDVLNQYPEYVQMNKPYAEKEDLINQLSKAFSLKEGRGKNVSTILTRLRTQGRGRTDLAREYLRRLDPTGKLESQVYGYLMKSPFRHGMSMTALGSLGGAYGLMKYLGHPEAATGALAALLATSPRMVAEGGNILGKGARAAKTVQRLPASVLLDLLSHAGANQ